MLALGLPGFEDGSSRPALPPGPRPAQVSPGGEGGCPRLPTPNPEPPPSAATPLGRRLGVCEMGQRLQKPSKPSTAVVAWPRRQLRARLPAPDATGSCRLRAAIGAPTGPPPRVVAQEEAQPGLSQGLGRRADIFSLGLLGFEMRVKGWGCRSVGKRF